MGEDRRSIDSASVVNLGHEENLSDILNSDDERALRPGSEGSQFSQGIRNSGFIEESASTTGYMEETNPAGNKTRRKSKSPGSPNLSANKTPEERKGSIISSDLSLDAGEQTVFLPVKMEKDNKKQEKPKKSKSFLSVTSAKKPIRRSSITPLSDNEGSRRNSTADFKASPKSLKVQAAASEGDNRRKSITNTMENDRKITTRPKDTYTRGKKTTTAPATENGTKSIFNEGLDDGESKSSAKNRNGRPITPVNTLRKSISIVASGGDGEGPGRNQKKIDVISRTPLNKRRKSAVVGVEQRESPGENRSKVNETSFSLDNGDKNGKDAADGKKKKKKQKAKKETKRKPDDSDDSSEEAMATLPLSVAGLNVIPATPEMSRRSSAVSQEQESKVKKKKKRKEREQEKKRKSEDSEASDKGEIAEDKTKELSVDILPETKRRNSVISDETQKKKKQKEATTTRRKSEIPGPEATRRNQETNGSFVQSAKSLKKDSLTVTEEKKRRKSLVIEDMEIKSLTSEEGSRRKSLIPESRPEIPADWKKPGAEQNVTRMVPDSISPIPTGHKSPRLIIKPSYHQY